MKLNRANLESATGTDYSPAPVRIVHMGLGAFHRAHQAWYTAQVDASKEWGIAAFTGRSAAEAEKLIDQDGLFTLITRGETDRFEVIDSIVEAHDGNDQAEFEKLVASPSTAIITLTVTEAGYGYDKSGNVNPGNLAPAMARLAKSLMVRSVSTDAPIAVVSCDNIPANGELLGRAMTAVFAELGAEKLEWLNSKVSFVSTSIDRITPKTTDADLALVASETGFEDASPVVTEPFSDWVLSGDFPAGRPAWEKAGARFVENIHDFENRKLWLLNGSHSLLAYAGQLRGHETVAQAIADETCLGWVTDFWTEAVNNLPIVGLDLDVYRANLLARFSNGNIAHRLGQIALDGATKLAVRVAPIALAQLAVGQQAKGCAVAVAAWVKFVSSREFVDSRKVEIETALAAEGDPVRNLVAVISDQLATNQIFMEDVKGALLLF
jgi:fructuronate reductase